MQYKTWRRHAQSFPCARAPRAPARAPARARRRASAGRRPRPHQRRGARGRVRCAAGRAQRHVHVRRRRDVAKHAERRAVCCVRGGDVQDSPRLPRLQRVSGADDQLRRRHRGRRLSLRAGVPKRVAGLCGVRCGRVQGLHRQQLMRGVPRKCQHVRRRVGRPGGLLVPAGLQGWYRRRGVRAVSARHLHRRGRRVGLLPLPAQQRHSLASVHVRGLPVPGRLHCGDGRRVHGLRRGHVQASHGHGRLRAVSRQHVLAEWSHSARKLHVQRRLRENKPWHVCALCTRLVLSRCRHKVRLPRQQLRAARLCSSRCVHLSARLLLVLLGMRALQRGPLLHKQHAHCVSSEQHSPRRQRFNRQLYVPSRISLIVYLRGLRQRSMKYSISSMLGWAFSAVGCWWMLQNVIASIVCWVLEFEKVSEPAIAVIETWLFQDDSVGWIILFLLSVLKFGIVSLKNARRQKKLRKAANNLAEIVEDGFDHRSTQIENAVKKLAQGKSLTKKINHSKVDSVIDEFKVNFMQTLASYYPLRQTNRWIPGESFGRDALTLFLVVMSVVIVLCHFRLSGASLFEVLRHRSAPVSSAIFVVYSLVVVVDLPVPRTWHPIKELLTSILFNVYANMMVYQIQMMLVHNEFDLEHVVSHHYVHLSCVCLFCLARAHLLVPRWTYTHQLVLELTLLGRASADNIGLLLGLVWAYCDESDSTQIFHQTPRTYTMLLMCPLSYLFNKEGYYYCWFVEPGNRKQEGTYDFHHDEYRYVVFWFNFIAVLNTLCNCYRQGWRIPVYKAKRQGRKMLALQNVMGKSAQDECTAPLSRENVAAFVKHYREWVLLIMCCVHVFTWIPVQDQRWFMGYISNYNDLSDEESYLNTALNMLLSKVPRMSPKNPPSQIECSFSG